MERFSTYILSAKTFNSLFKNTLCVYNAKWSTFVILFCMRPCNEITLEEFLKNDCTE